MAGKLTNAEYAILGLLVERPCHGYDLERLIEERGMRDWTELAFSSIYYVLKQLEKRRFIQKTAQANPAKKNRKTFIPTSQGYRIHKKVTLQFLGEPHPTYPSVLLGMANWPSVEMLDALNALKHRKDKLKIILENLTAQVGVQPAFVNALFDYGISQIKSELDWIERTRINFGENLVKIDLKKKLKDFYHSSSKEPVFVDIPLMNYLMIDGTGDPNNSESYSQAVEALFTVSYGAKFDIKKSDIAIDYGVMPLEGLWWTENPADFSLTDRRPWKWTAMIMQPEWATSEIIESARNKAMKKLNRPLADIRFEPLNEGRVAQIMHLGPYDAEESTIATLHRFIAENSLSLKGKHHEIYLSDPRRTKPERLKTIIRQPVS